MRGLPATPPTSLAAKTRAIQRSACGSSSASPSMHTSNLVARQHRAGVERRRLAAVLGEMDDAQARDLADQAIEHLGGVVAAAVVDGDDLEVGIVDAGGGAQRLLGVVALVVAGHEDRDRRPMVDRRRIRRRRQMALVDEVVDQAARHPVPGHDEGIAEAELRDGQQDEFDRASSSRPVGIGGGRERRGKRRRRRQDGGLGQSAKAVAPLALTLADGVDLLRRVRRQAEQQRGRRRPAAASPRRAGGG